MFKNFVSKIATGVQNAGSAVVSFVKRNAVPAAKAFVLCFFICFGCPAFAEGEGSVDFSTSAGAITDTATGLRQYIEPVQNICYIVAALIGLIGGLTTALAMSNHEQDVTKKAAFTIGGMAFMVAIGYLIPTFFGLTGN